MIKLMITMAALLATTAFAEESTNVCDRFMTCGTYVHARDKNNPDSDETKIVITSTGPMTADFDYVLTDAEGHSQTWPLKATFDEEGHGVLRWKGVEIYATMICKFRICNYGLIPFHREDRGAWGNAGLLRFTDTALEFAMIVGVPTNYGRNDMVMQKQ